MAVAREALGVSGDYVAPQTQTQVRLARLWSEKLRVEPVGLDDDFFELGGDSLLAADVQLAIDRTFGVEVPTWVLFDSPTIEQLALAIEAARPGSG